MIRKLAITGVTSIEQYEKVCELVGDGEVKETQEDIDECILKGECTLYDDGCDEVFMWFWGTTTPSDLIIMTYDEFIEKYD